MTSSEFTIQDCDFFKLTESKKANQDENHVYKFYFKFYRTGMEDLSRWMQDLNEMFESITWDYDVWVDASNLDFIGNSTNLPQIAQMFMSMTSKRTQKCEIVLPNSPYFEIAKGILSVASLFNRSNYGISLSRHEKEDDAPSQLLFSSTE